MRYQHAVQGWPRVTLVTALLLGILFSSLDALIVSTSLVTISIHLQDFLNAPWVVLAYLLAYLGFAIGFAKMSDIYGRRGSICVAWLLFSGFSIGCALASTMPQLIVCRAFQGIGGSGLSSLGQIALFEVGLADKACGALIGITLAVSYVLGPVVGGALTSTASWRWIFWINVPVGVLVIVAVSYTWPPMIMPLFRGWEATRRIDYPGNLLIISACSFFVFALQQAGSYTYAWNSPVIISSFCAAFVSWAAFVTWEVLLSLRPLVPLIEPVLPMRLATKRVFVACVVCTFCTGFTFLPILVILPERFQIVNGDDALFSGIHLLPLLGATSFGAFVAGAASRKRNNTSWTLLASQCLHIIGVGLMSILRDSTTEYKGQYGFQVILGMGIGLSLGATAIMAAVQSHDVDLAVAQGAIAQARALGGSVGIAVCSIVFNKKVSTALGGVMDPDDMSALHHSPTIAPWLPPDMHNQVKTVYASAFTDNIEVMIGICAVGLVASILAYEKTPPALPTVRRAERSLIIGGSSETELEELVRSV
ncbi:MFS general substrate transporter [Xylariomycetidae sp. FL2044]|nr:MFS general substrate transporter [Xylariomycetidae sp. FL2044]